MKGEYIMKVKQILCIVLTAIFILSFAGCNEKDNQENIQNNSASTANNSTNDEVISKPNDTKDDEVLKEECKKALEGIKVELLAITFEKYDDAEINGNLAYSEDYETATLLTMGVKFPQNVYSEFYKNITICGETATGKDGKPAVQTKYNASWISENKEYSLMVMRIGGKVDPAKVTVRLNGNIYGADKITVDTKFENNGSAIGFDTAKSFFVNEDNAFGCDSNIVKLKNRHYIITRRYTSSDGWTTSNDVSKSTQTRSYVLIPLEKGLKRTLTKKDVNMEINGKIPNTEATLMVNENGIVDASTLDCQTTIEVEFARTVIEQKDSEGNYTDEVYDKIDEDIENLAKMTTVKIDDGDGKQITLKMK